VKRLHKLLTVFLLLVLPAQGIAATYSPLHKMQVVQSAAEMPCHGDHAHHGTATTTGDSTQQNSGSDTDAAGHICCHQVLSCAPSAEIRTATQKVSDVPQAVLLLHTLFVPESPYRPPRG